MLFLLCSFKEASVHMSRILVRHFGKMEIDMETIGVWLSGV